MITGQQAFKAHYEQAVVYSILNEEPESVTSVRSGVPMELEWILGKALAKTADRRYQSAIEFAVDLDTLLSKLQSAGATAARSVLRPPPPQTRQGITPPPGPVSSAVQTTAEMQSQQGRRRTRDLLLELGGQGLLPDRLLSQALELLGKPAHQMLPADRRREELLQELSQSRRVGEFIEHWQQVDAPPAPSLARQEEQSAAEACPAREWRTRMQIFGLPLVHCARGVDPRTGKRRVAKGIVAVGEVAIGGIAVGAIAFGGLAFGGISMGLLAAGAIALGVMTSAGAIAVGPSAFGAITFSLGQGLLNGTLRVVLAVFLLRLLIRRRRFRKRYGDDGGAVSVWAIFGGREWRSDGTPFRGGNVVATLGGCEVDLTGTTLAGPDVMIEVTAMLGGVKIIVPYGWRIVTQGSQLFGAYANKTRPPQTTMAEAAPRLLVKGFALGGAVEVTHEPEHFSQMS